MPNTQNLRKETEKCHSWVVQSTRELNSVVGSTGKHTCLNQPFMHPINRDLQSTICHQLGQILIKWKTQIMRNYRLLKTGAKEAMNNVSEETVITSPEGLDDRTSFGLSFKVSSKKKRVL